MRHIRHLTSSLVITLIVHQFHAPGNVSSVQVCVSPVQVMFHLAANNYTVAYTDEKWTHDREKIDIACALGSSVILKFNDAVVYARAAPASINRLSSPQWLKCKIRGAGTLQSGLGPLTMVVCFSLAL